MIGKIQMTTDYRHFFENGDVVEVPGECDLQKAKQLVSLDRAIWLEKPGASMDMLKDDMIELAKSLGLSTSGTKKDLLERINNN